MLDESALRRTTRPMDEEVLRGKPTWGAGGRADTRPLEYLLLAQLRDEGGNPLRAWLPEIRERETRAESAAGSSGVEAERKDHRRRLAVRCSAWLESEAMMSNTTKRGERAMQWSRILLLTVLFLYPLEVAGESELSSYRDRHFKTHYYERSKEGFKTRGFDREWRTKYYRKGNKFYDKSWRHKSRWEKKSRKK